MTATTAFACRSYICILVAAVLYAPQMAFSSQINVASESSARPATNTIVESKEDSNWFDSKFLTGTFVALAALVVSGLSYRHSVSSSKRNRQQSIDDEYWLRTVISPQIIEPAIRHILESINTLPLPDTNSTPAAFGNTAKQFVVQFQQDHAEITSSCVALSIFDMRLYTDVVSCLDGIEDLILEYSATASGLVAGGKSSEALALRANAKRQIFDSLTAAIRKIRDFQLSLGS